jgi:hypothetical protein
MKFTKNVVKGLITSTIGMATMIVTLFLIFTGSMDFVWSGVVGLAVGCVLLLAPDTIVKRFGDLLGNMSGKGNVSANTNSIVADTTLKETKKEEKEVATEAANNTEITD